MNRTLRARQLRRAMTPQEARLWLELRSLRAQGFHFRRQAPFKRFFLDFACFKARLAVEVDGGQHSEGAQAAHDAVRDAILAGAGIRTLRVSNGEINTNLDGVMHTILHALGALPERSENSRTSHSAHLLPLDGGGGAKRRKGWDTNLA